MKFLKDTSLTILLLPSALWVLLLLKMNAVDGFSMVNNNIPSLNLRQSIFPSLSSLQSASNNDEEEEEDEVMDALSPEDVQYRILRCRKT